MTFEELIKLTRRQVVAIAIGLFTGLFLSLVVVWLTPVSYKASADAYVRVTVSQQTDSYYAASQLATQKVKAFVPVFTSDAVAQGVIDSLGLDTTSAELSRSLSATNKNNTLTITVTATASSASEARASGPGGGPDRPAPRWGDDPASDGSEDSGEAEDSEDAWSLTGRGPSW